MHGNAKFLLDPRLAGCKKAVTNDGRRIMVSPAFYSLLKGAETDAERRALLRSLRVVDTRLAVPDVFSPDRLARRRREVAEISRRLTGTEAR